ncbi:unnamed protein product [Penicillium pancosmium]
MADEARVKNYKKNFHNAAERALVAKQAAKKRYDEAKEYGMTNDTFDDWIPVNDPAFMEAYHVYTDTNYMFTEAFTFYDEVKADEWNKKFKDLRSKWHIGYFDNGKEKGSNFIIITDEDVDNYDAILEEQSKNIGKNV